MCLSPNSIPNPNYGVKCKVGDFNSLKDCTSKYIRVPCGYCSECIKTKQMYLIQRVQMESLDKYVFFATLTYDKEHLPSVVTSSGYDIKYADWHDLQNCLKRLRKSFSRPFKYLAVSERGSSRGRPHFHILFFVPKYESDLLSLPYTLEKELYDKLRFNWSRNVGTNRKPIYEPLFTFQERWLYGKRKSNFDLHFVISNNVDDGNSSVSFYVTKYMLKLSDKERRLQQALHLNLDPFEYEEIWSLVKSRVITSKGFGLALNSDGSISDHVISYLRNCIDKSSDFAKFYNPINGKGFPLSRYYKGKGAIYKLEDAMRFYMSDGSDRIDSVPDFDVISKSELLNKIHKNEKISDSAFNRGDFDEYADLFD